MASPSVTYTFSNSTTADATQVNQNFTDIINGITDGTKDLSISALTCAGTATLNGNVAIGNSSADTLTITAVLSSTLALGTTFTYDIGSSTVGLRSLYLGASDSAARSVRLLAGAVSSSYSITLPTAVPSVSNSVMALTSAGVGSFEPKSTRAVTSKTTTYTATLADDVILVSGSGGAWSLTLPAAATSTGKVLQIIRTDDTPANAVTLDANSTETIQGAETRALYTQYESVTIICDGSNWQVLEHKTDTAWASVTLTTTWTSNVTWTAFWRRSGDTAFYDIHGAVTGAPTSATLEITLNFTMDTAKLGSTNTSSQELGTVVAHDTGAAVYHDRAIYASSTTTKAQIDTSGSYYSQAAPHTWANGDSIHIRLSAPISGWWA